MHRAPVNVSLLYIDDIGGCRTLANTLFWRQFVRMARCLLAWPQRQGWRFWEGEFTMSRFDEDTSTMRMRIEATPIELRKPEIGPQSKARGIYIGVLLGVVAWAAIIALLVEVRRWLR